MILCIDCFLRWYVGRLSLLHRPSSLGQRGSRLMLIVDNLLATLCFLDTTPPYYPNKSARALPTSLVMRSRTTKETDCVGACGFEMNECCLPTSVTPHSEKELACCSLPVRGIYHGAQIKPLFGYHSRCFQSSS
ncbi:unnamed protein product [Ectocarpus sp. 12 AP-2014]